MGHSIGIGPIDPPIPHAIWNFIMQPGMTFSVYTPHLGDPSVGGLHIERGLITETGCEVYSSYPYTGIDD